MEEEIAHGGGDGGGLIQPVNPQGIGGSPVRLTREPGYQRPGFPQHRFSSKTLFGKTTISFDIKTDILLGLNPVRQD